MDKDGVRPLDKVLIDYWWTLLHTTGHGRRWWLRWADLVHNVLEVN